jgi:hypothetical protein
MKILKAKIKNNSPLFNKGLSLSGKPVWLLITGFKPIGEKNFKIKAIKSYSEGYAEYEEIWVSSKDITLKHFVQDHPGLDLYTEEQWQELKHNPVYRNKYRYEIETPNEKQYLYAQNLDMAKDLAKQMGILNFKIKPVTKIVHGK